MSEVRGLQAVHVPNYLAHAQLAQVVGYVYLTGGQFKKNKNKNLGISQQTSQQFLFKIKL